MCPPPPRSLIHQNRLRQIGFRTSESQVKHNDDIDNGLIGSPRLEPSWWANGWGRTGSRRVTVTQELSTPPRLKATQGVRSRPNPAGIPFETVGVELGSRGGKKDLLRLLSSCPMVWPGEGQIMQKQKHQEWASSYELLSLTRH